MAVGDAAGNLYQGDRDYRYYYDFENRLARVDRKAMGPIGGGEFGPEGGPVIPYRTVALFDYDALGRRIWATYFDTYQHITADTLYYYDGQRVLAEFDYDEATAEQTLLRYFVDGPLYVDEHLLMHDATTGQECYYLLQELYTVAGLVDENGDLVEAYAYDAYGDVRTFDMTGGSPVQISVSAIGNPYHFTGRRLDAIPNPWAIPVRYRRLYHYRAREYDPRHGRFLQRDPAEYADGMNLYEYVQSRPGVLLDPFGGVVEPENIRGPGAVYAEACRDIERADVAFRQYWRATLNPLLKDWEFDFSVRVAIRQYVHNLYRAVYMAKGFSPGGAEVRTMDNRFVYTCKEGWIDIGHYSYSALGAYLLGQPGALLAGMAVEEFQLMWHGIQSKLGQQLDGNALSPFTIEDLPSNLLGAKAGRDMLRSTALHRVAFQGWRPGPLRGLWAYLSRELGVYDLHSRLETDLIRSEAVNPDLRLESGPLRGQTARETLRKNAESQLHRQFVQFTFKGQKIPQHYCICDEKDRPRHRREKTIWVPVAPF